MAQDITTTLEFDPVTGEFYKLQRTRTPVDPGPLAQFLVGNGTMSLLPMLTPQDHIALTPKGQLFIAHEMLEIPFRSAVNVVDQGSKGVALLPDFYGNAGVRDSDMQLVYAPPEDQALMLLLYPEEGRSHLVAVCRNTAATYHPGIPNTYSDCSLCVGASPVPNQTVIMTRGIAGYLEMWLTAWSQCEFNADLNTDLTERVCTFDPATGRNLPLGRTWQEMHPRVSLHQTETEILTLLWKTRLRAERKS